MLRWHLLSFLAKLLVKSRLFYLKGLHFRNFLCQTTFNSNFLLKLYNYKICTPAFRKNTLRKNIGMKEDVNYKNCQKKLNYRRVIEFKDFWLEFFFIRDIHSVAGAKTTAKQEIRLTAPIDGLDLLRSVECVTPAPKNITGSRNIFGGLNIKHTFFYSLFDAYIQYKSF